MHSETGQRGNSLAAHIEVLMTWMDWRTSIRWSPFHLYQSPNLSTSPCIVTRSQQVTHPLDLVRFSVVDLSIPYHYKISSHIHFRSRILCHLSCMHLGMEVHHHINQEVNLQVFLLLQHTNLSVLSLQPIMKLEQLTKLDPREIQLSV